MTQEILLVGFAPGKSVANIQRLLPTITIVPVQDPCEASQYLADPPILIVIDAPPGEPAIQSLLVKLQEANRAPVFCYVHRERPQWAKQLVEELGVERLFFHPLDEEELAHQISQRVDIPYNPPPSPDTAALLRRIWEKHKSSTDESVAKIVSAAYAQEAGENTDAAQEIRQEGVREAHRLAGSLGTFGFVRASKLSGQLEKLLVTDTPGEKLVRLVKELQDSLSDDSPEGGYGLPRKGLTSKSYVLLVEDDPALSEALAQEARSRGLAVQCAGSLEEAQRLLVEEVPKAVVLDLNVPSTGPVTARAEAGGMRLLRRLNRHHSEVPVLVLTGTTDFLDRVETARLGARSFLNKPISVEHTFDELTRHLEYGAEARSTVLALDDDPTILEALQLHLDGPTVKLVPLSDPLQFWTVLEETNPDLVILDLDLPKIHGLEICRVLRNDPTFSHLPILVLTASTDHDTVNRVYAAGADDFVAKPILVAELQTRINNRLERTKLLKSLAETDPLTGLSNRRKSSQVIEQFMRLAARQNQPLSMAAIDIDHFKSLNDGYGHAVGDQVLRRFAQLMQAWFRGEDVVARWGGEEFFVSMYGMNRVDGVHRLAELLESVREEKFFPEQTRPITFSAGVVQCVGETESLSSLYRHADEALYKAKADGRNRVRGYPLERGLARLLHFRPEFAARLQLALQTRGYEVNLGSLEDAKPEEIVFAPSSLECQSLEFIVVPDGEPHQAIRAALAQLRSRLAERAKSEKAGPA